MKLLDLNLNENILKGIKESGFTEFLEVQKKTIPHVLQGKDVLVQSQTGTGKTAAYLLPILQLLSEKNYSGKALVVVPTRELAIQVEKEAKKLGKYTPCKTVSIYGGVGYSQQEKKLKDGAQFNIATPGRLLDLGNRGKFDFKEMDFVVIDEADRLFDMGFMQDIRKIFNGLKSKEERVTMLFSATLNHQVKNLAQDYMKNVAEIELSPDNITVDKINQTLYHVGKKEKISLLLGILKRDNPQNGIIFVNTKSQAFEIASRLNYSGIKSEYLMGDLPQAKRSKIIEDFKANKTPMLIATDVASRGLHVENLELVINFDLPMDSESYVHRIGRTARAGKSGRAISFACEEFVKGLAGIEDYIKMKIPVEWAEDNLFVKDKSANVNFSMKGSRSASRTMKKPNRRGQEKNTRVTKIQGATQGNVKSRKSQSNLAENRISHPKPIQKSKRNISVPAPKVHLGSDYWENKNKTNTPQPTRKKGVNLNERLEYYKAKYGENFNSGEIDSKEEKSWKRISFLKKVSGFLFRKYSV